MKDTTQTTPYLKACPFCKEIEPEIRIRKTAIIQCTNCGCLFIKKDRAYAIRAWNKRWYYD